MRCSVTIPRHASSSVWGPQQMIGDVMAEPTGVALGITSLGDYAHQNVALGEDADDPPVLGHHQATYAERVHLLRCLDHRSRTLDRCNVSPLAIQDVLRRSR